MSKVPDHSSRILLIQLRAIGDVLLTTPLVRAVKQRFPDAEVDFLTNPAPAELLQGNPYLHDVLVYPYRADDILGAIKFYRLLHKKRYDIAVDVLGTPGTAQMTFFSRAAIRIGYDLPYRKLAYNRIVPEARDDQYNAIAKLVLLKPLGIDTQEHGLDLVIPEEDRAWAKELFDSRGWTGKKVVAVAPAAKRQARRWLPERFAEVAQWLQDQGCVVLLPWGPGEREYVQSVADAAHPSAILTPETTLMRLAAILELCDLLVCNCGGTKHFAVAVGTPTLSINGASNPVAWTPPDDPRHRWIEADNVDCLHCVLKECENLQCMTSITSQQVITAIEAMNILERTPS